ncbi:hypothetical protein B0H14DRAFT_60069 [Mycena olivaceomarginata]|nr:hypothetical protein B0H14DRAFT_60069 [Mycena olivaceomarginata]
MVDNVPLLHEVVMIAAAPSFVVLPWEQLTKFTGELYEAKHCLEALCVMPNLLECGFSAFKYDVMEDGPSDAGQFGTVSHRNIEHLTLSGSTFYTDRPFGGHILTLIILPALQTLEFSGNYGFDAEELDSFLRHSSPPLRKLAVCPLEGGIEVRLSKPFRNLTRLVELEISRPLGTFVSGFLAVLGCDSSVLPQLQKLAFLGCHIPEDEEDDIEPKLEANVDEILRHAAEPITKRWAILPGCAQLQSFCVTSESSAYFEEDLLPFRELKNSGMDVYIGTGGPSVI